MRFFECLVITNGLLLLLVVGTDGFFICTPVLFVPLFSTNIIFNQ
jgi:hypothetical protein